MLDVNAKIKRTYALLFYGKDNIAILKQRLVSVRSSLLSKVSLLNESLASHISYSGRLIQTNYIDQLTKLSEKVSDISIDANAGSALTEFSNLLIGLTETLDSDEVTLEIESFKNNIYDMLYDNSVTIDEIIAIKNNKFNNVYEKIYKLYKKYSQQSETLKNHITTVTDLISLCDFSIWFIDKNFIGDNSDILEESSDFVLKTIGSQYSEWSES